MSLTGAHAMVAALRRVGIDVCFANPGTTEIPVLAAFDEIGGVRGILTLFEGVAAGAADGYARIARRPAMTLLHLGPGLGNAVANLHNARRAGTPVLNVVGDHATWHRGAGSPLESDIEALARTVSGWVRTVGGASVIAKDVAEAAAAAVGPPSGVATLIVPMDCQSDDIAVAIPPTVRGFVASPNGDRSCARAALAAGPTCVLLIGGDALGPRGLHAAARIERQSGCRVFTETFSARVTRGRNVPWFRTLPYFPERARAALGDLTTMVLAGASSPVSMFGGTDGTSRPVADDVAIVDLAESGASIEEALECLAEDIGAGGAGTLPPRPVREFARSVLDPTSMGAVVASVLPEDSVVVDEGGTSSYGYVAASPRAAPHIAIGLTGGAIGSGLPMAVGAAVAAPGRRVVALQADGSGMYTNQALWTLARESLDVTVLVLANRRYAILETELERAGVRAPGPIASSLTDLRDPPIDWVALANGLGVPGQRAASVDELESGLSMAMRTPGPALIEVVL